MSSALQDTAELPAVGSFSDTFFSCLPFNYTIQFGAATHQGHVRSNNEDQFAVIKRSRVTETLLSSLGAEQRDFPVDAAYSLVVADGIGGARAGEVASRVALETMLELGGQATSWVMKLTDLDAQQMRDRILAYLERVQHTLQTKSLSDPKLLGMGTTWTSAHIFPGQAVIVHVGDSRAYLRYDDQLLQITRDETMAQAMIDAGVDPQQARRYRHVLINSLGGKHDDVTAQIHQVGFGPGDQLLLCTDGLSDLVSAPEMDEELQRQPTAQDACDGLIRRALEAGGKDNVTVVVASALRTPV